MGVSNSVSSWEWPMPMVEQPDLVVIGMGVGGEEVAGRAVEAGMRVLGVERRLVGGECPYWGASLRR